MNKLIQDGIQRRMRMSQEIAKVLDLLAERFGTTIEHLWEVMIRQAYIEAIMGIFVFALLLVVNIKFIKWAKPITTNDDHETWEKWGVDGVMPVMASGFIMLVISCIAFLMTIDNLVAKLVNPEYWALQQILELLN